MANDARVVQAKIGGRAISRIWIVPVVAVLIGFWMLYLNLASKGPLIEISFVSGEGIEAGKTKVKRRNVEVGEVQDLRLSEGAESVVLTVQMSKHAADLLSTDSSFWVVRPRIGKGGISGLGTLLSGPYIELNPGTNADSASQFEGLERPPVTPIGTPGLHVTLDSDGNRPLNVGDPILFHGLEVGTIEFVHFNSQERRTYYNAFIEAPYDRLITSNTRFWFSSGLSANLSADGIRIEMTSLEAVIAGGVSFDVPDGQPRGEVITERAFFNIYPQQSAINERQYDQALSYMVLFDDSIRGLRPGAPVEYRGVKVGEVLRTDIDYPEIENLLDPQSRVPVLIEIVPGRLGYADDESANRLAGDQINTLVAGGLRAGLATGNLLTGRKFIELKHHEGELAERQSFAEFMVIPSVNGQLDQLLANANRTLDAIAKLPLDQLVDSANDTFEQATDTLAAFRQSALELDEILADPASHEVMGVLNSALDSFRELAIDFSEGSATNREFQQSLQSLEQTLTELEPVLRNLRQRPNSLIFGGRDEADTEPQGAQE